MPLSLNKLNYEYDCDINIIMTYSAGPLAGWSGETHDLSVYLDRPPEIKTSIRNV